MRWEKLTPEERAKYIEDRRAQKPLQERKSGGIFDYVDLPKAQYSMSNDDEQYLLPTLVAGGPGTPNRLLWDQGRSMDVPEPPPTDPGLLARRDAMGDQGARRKRVKEEHDALLARRDAMLARRPQPAQAAAPTEQLTAQRETLLREIEERNRVLKEIEARMGAVTKSTKR